MATMTTSASINISPSTHVSGPVASPRIGSLGNGSFRDAVAGSLGREVSHLMDYSLSKFGTSASSDITVAPSTSYGNTHRLDSNFCRSFQCCGKPLEDLHELLAHYEAEHTKDDYDDDFNDILDDDTMSEDDGSSRSSKSPSPRMINSTPALLKRKAFDSHDDHDHLESPISASKKRSFGSFSLAGPTPSHVHQSLRRALIDGGVGGRRIPGSPSIYSANSPFSTPGSSMPGTPAIGNEENEAYFTGALAANAFAGLSLRPNATEDHQMPSCAPPNLFFPAAGASSSTVNGPPSKRERMNNGNAVIPSTSLAGGSLSAAAAAAIAAAGAHDPIAKAVNTPGVSAAAVAAAAAAGGPNGIDSKPFKCPEPGCDKAYKQMNGLKYHKLHGHCNQNNLPPALQTQNNHARTIAIGTSQSSIAGPSSAGLTSASAAAAGSSGASGPHSPVTAKKPGMPGTAADSSQSNTGVNGDMAEPSTPIGSTPGSPGQAVINATPEKMYLCQVGSCGKRYKNLNGLRYHYLHSGSHGLLGLQLLHANGGGASAKMDPATGNATVSTLNLSEEAVAAAARAAAEQQAARVQKMHAIQQAQKASAAAAAAAGLPAVSTSTAAAPVPAVTATVSAAPTPMAGVSTLAL